MATCPICDSDAPLLDVVDFSKNCEEPRGQFLPLSGIPVYYALCGACGFCFAPEMCAWPRQKFVDLIYNDSYTLVDPDYVVIRPDSNAANLLKLFGSSPNIRHLDYGGGHGLMSDLLRDAGWDSRSYDPFVDEEDDGASDGRFDLITAFEVFEHVPDARQLMEDLSQRMAPDGVVLFSTLISDGEIVRGRRVTWWYASPRNGHIGLFSAMALHHLARQFALNIHSFSANFHAFWRHVPPWANHVLPDSAD